jgi:hypothetical protein
MEYFTAALPGDLQSALRTSCMYTSSLYVYLQHSSHTQQDHPSNRSTPLEQMLAASTGTAALHSDHQII